MKSKSLINSCIFTTTLLLAPYALQAAPDPVVSPTLHAFRVAFETECYAVLRKFVPKLSYTGLALAAGTAGICASFDGYKRRCNGIDTKNELITCNGTKELSVGLGTTAASIATIYLLWR